MLGYLSPSHVEIVILTASDALTNLPNLTALGVQTFCSLKNEGNIFRKFYRCCFDSTLQNLRKFLLNTLFRR